MTWTDTTRTGAFRSRSLRAELLDEAKPHWGIAASLAAAAVSTYASQNQKTIKLTTPMEYLAENPTCQVAAPSFSSWGHKGYDEVWLNATNDWIYRHLHTAADRMVELARQFPDADGPLRRALNQAARELLLAQSSDWAFIMKTGSHVEYAVKRTQDHVLRFTRIYDDIRANRIDETWLADIEYKDNLFPDINYRVYA